MPQQGTILVIDDDVQFVETVKTLLESTGSEVVYAYQAERGMQIAREIRPDLIILDVMFVGPPGPDGIELSRRLDQDPVLSDIPVIILTGVRRVLNWDFGADLDPERLPVDAFLEKPVKPRELLAAIKEILEPRGGE